MLFSYLLPLIAIAGMGFYYFNFYRKGKAAGGGMMKGIAIAANDKWRDVMQQGEEGVNWGFAMLWRPAWQTMLASNIPVLRLVWPTVQYQVVITNQQRILIGESGTFGLKKKRAFSLSEVGLTSSAEEKVGMAMKLNPLYRTFGQDHKTYDINVTLPDGQARWTGVPATFVAALPNKMPAPQQRARSLSAAH